MRPTVSLALVATGLLAACEPASPLVDTSGVREATPAEVAYCTPLKVLTTTTGISGTIGREKALELARNETKQNAREGGADTVVYETGGPGSNDLYVRAATYRCL